LGTLKRPNTKGAENPVNGVARAGSASERKIMIAITVVTTVATTVLAIAVAKRRLVTGT